MIPRASRTPVVALALLAMLSTRGWAQEPEPDAQAQEPGAVEHQPGVDHEPGAGAVAEPPGAATAPRRLGRPFPAPVPPLPPPDDPEFHISIVPSQGSRLSERGAPSGEGHDLGGDDASDTMGGGHELHDSGGEAMDGEHDE